MNKYAIAGKFLEVWFSDVVVEGIQNWRDIQNNLLKDLIKSKTTNPFHYILRNKEYKRAVVNQGRWLAYSTLYAYISARNTAIRFSRFSDRIGITKGQYQRLWKAFRYKFFWLSLVNDVKVIEKVRDVIDKMVEQGIPTSEAIKRYSELLGDRRYYAETVFRTNLTSHYNLGVVDSFDAEYFEYSAIIDERTTQICQRLNGKIFKRSETSLIPPNHYNCRSIVVPVNIPLSEPLTIHDIEKIEKQFPEWQDFLEPTHLVEIPTSVWESIKQYVSEDEIEKINRELEALINE